MLKLTITALLFAAMALLNACSGAARIDGRGYDIEVESDEYHHHNGPRDFCPPGQRKKGNC